MSRLTPPCTEAVASRPISFLVDSGSIWAHGAWVCLDSRAPKIGTCNSNFSGTLQSPALLDAGTPSRAREMRLDRFLLFDCAIARARSTAILLHVKVDANRRSYYLVSIDQHYLVCFCDWDAWIMHKLLSKTYANSI